MRRKNAVAGLLVAVRLAHSELRKGYGSWGREYSQEYWPQEVGLDGLIKLDKDFLHKDAYLKIKENPPRTVLSVFEIDVSHDADASGGEPIFTTDWKTSRLRDLRCVWIFRRKITGYRVGQSSGSKRR
jgi:glycine cleavage system aminomethyltransferase T